jgi:arylsulfatase B
MNTVDATRRDFLKAVGVGAAAAATAPSVLAAGEASGRRPNVVLVITDDQGYGDLACHGNPLIETPNLDTLHGESVRLTDFHVGPTCSPTRASLMTGRYCNRTGVWHTIMGRSLLGSDEVTVADVFAASGYRTGMFGKWHLGDNYPFRPEDRGFQDVLAHKGGGVGNSQDFWGNDYFDDTYFRNSVPEKFTGYCTDVWFAEAMKFIGANKNRPFFCYLSTNAPHGPHLVPEKYIRMYTDKGVKEGLARFYGMITCIDENMGRLMRQLDSLGLSDNTILIFMTDNGGDPVGGPGKFNAGMRGSKGSMHDGGHRVPFFIRWPASGLGGGQDIDRLTAHIDVMPTFVELCGLRQPDGVRFDGQSLLPLLTGQAGTWPDRVMVTDSQRVDHCIKWRRSATMTDRWRLINGEELYDMDVDPGQEQDVASEHPEVVERLRQAYEQWWTSVSETFDEYPRIVLGSPEENPTCLTSHDIHGQVVWNQGQVRRAQRCDGFWAVEIDRDGTYEFGLRRWPREADRPITEPVSAHADEPESRRIVTTDARLKVGDFDQTVPIPPGATEVTFTVPLKAGKTRLQAWFINGLGDGATHGVYYVYVIRGDG